MSAAFARPEKRSDAPARPAPKSAVAQRLRVGAAGDTLEREADRVADEVMGTSFASARPLAQAGAGSLLQRKCACGGAETECEECRKEKTLQRKATGGAEISQVPDTVYEVLRSGGQPLDRTARGFFESRFHHDFSRVRIHADGKAAESADAVHAHAYASGSHVVFGQGQYAPGSARGQRLLAHELAHVVQQGGAAALGRHSLLATHSDAEREAKRAGNSALPGAGMEIRSRMEPGQIGRAEKDGPPQPQTGGAGTGSSAGAGGSPGAGHGAGGTAKPQPLRFDIVGADTPLADFLAAAARRARDPDLRVASLEDLIKKLEDQTPEGSGRCVEHINIYNHGRPGYQLIAGGVDKKGKAPSTLPKSYLNMEWLYNPTNQAALSRLRHVFCCGASMDWLGCGVAGVEAEGGKRTKDEIEKAGKISADEKSVLDERYKELGDRYQSEEDAQKHGANLQGATFGKITVGTWADATCTSIRAATDFVFHNASAGTYRVGFRGEFLDMHPSSAGQCSCDASTGRVQGKWSPGAGVEPGSASWQQHLQWFSQAVQPASGAANPAEISRWLRELLADVGPQLEIPSGLTVNPKPEPWINATAADPGYIAMTFDHLALCKPEDVWKWIAVNRTIIAQTPAFTRTVLNHELQHAADIAAAAAKFKQTNGPAPAAPADACRPGYKATESDPFGKYVLEFHKFREAGASPSRHLEIYASSAAKDFQHFTPEEKLSWFTSMITEVPPDVRLSDPLPTEPLVASMYTNPLPYEASMRVKFEAKLFDAVRTFIYGTNGKGVNLGKARTLLSHFNPVWAINPSDRGILAGGVAGEEKKGSQSQP